MKTLNTLLQKYLIFASPVVLATMVWGSFQSDSEIRATSSFFMKALWEVMSYSLMLWFLSLIVFMFLLIFRKETQESTIKRLAGIQERDEREEVVMGLAARRSFVATTSLLIALLFASCFTLSVARLQNQTVDGKKSSLSIGFHFAGTDAKTSTSPDGLVRFEHHDLPLSKSALLLLVLVWQMGSFRISAKRELGQA